MASYDISMWTINPQGCSFSGFYLITWDQNLSEKGSEEIKLDVIEG
jgi:hypothetical protein